MSFVENLQRYISQLSQVLVLVNLSNIWLNSERFEMCSSCGPVVSIYRVWLALSYLIFRKQRKSYN